MVAASAWEYEATGNGVSIKSHTTSPRHWLESLPDGAYTVIRCDRIRKNDEEEDWIVWGENFHCRRLEESFRLLFPDCSMTKADEASIIQRNGKKTLHTLLTHAGLVDTIDSSATTANMGQVYMVTLLAYLPPGDHHPATTVPIVKGHIAPGPAIVHPLVPIANQDGIQAAMLPPFPMSRLSNPRAKDSAWCRERRPMEVATTTDEVIMLEGDSVLEGLTSNVFVVDDGGKIQTSSSDKVLNGFIRDRLLKLHPSIQCQAANVNDMDSWKTVFCTSSIRLVVPVRSIVVDGKEVWNSSNDTMFVETLYKELVLEQYKRAGQEHLCSPPLQQI